MNDDIKDIIHERGLRYGSPKDFNDQLKLVWTGMLGRKLKPNESLSSGECVAMMLAFKALRCMNNENYADSWVDAAGYAHIGEMFATLSNEDINKLTRTLQLIRDNEQRKQKDRSNTD